MLRTKSLQMRKTVKDGLRVCIMRRIKPEYQFDVWFPVLAPSEILLKRYVIDKKIGWEEFRPLFLKQLGKKKSILALLADLSKHRLVTLLCWEVTPEFCHRRLIAEEIKKMYPRVDVEIS